jgi:hypothetical protein
MPSDIPDRPRAAEQSFENESARTAYRAALAETARSLALAVTTRDAARETGAALEGDDRAQQAMFEDIDAILARVESGIAVERVAMNALLDRLRNKA